MRRTAAVLVLIPILLSILSAGQVIAGPFEDASTAYERGNYKKAYQLLKPLAEKGDASAQFNLATLFRRGQGVPQDYAKALKWYRKAADQGHAYAQYNLGIMHEKGQGVPQDYAEALKWYGKAADQGDAYAQYNLGLMHASGKGVPQDDVLAHMWLNLAASGIPSTDLEIHSNVVEARNRVASKMSPTQIAEAQRLAREWRPKKEK